jgi:hypothetical protein
MIKDYLEDVCFPINFAVDLEKLRGSIAELFNDLSITREFFLEESRKFGFSTLNLTHLKNLEKEERWKKYRGNHKAVIDAGVDEKDFSIFLKEIENSYLGQTIEDLQHFHFKNHGTLFQGRCQLIWINPGRCYPLHVDAHTPDRYHIPVETDPNCWFLFQDKNITPVHLPADGRVWYLNPQKQKHTVVHLGCVPRMHLLLTSGYHDE